jgi:hypothetical protein
MSVGPLVGRVRVILLVGGASLSPFAPDRVAAQDREDSEAAERPPLHLMRAEEDYSYLRRGSSFAPDAFDALKFIPLAADGGIYLTLGGEFRPRVEFFEHPDWTVDREGFYSQRLSLHASANLGENVRLFGEVYHGLLSRGEPEFAEDDDLDLHQGFIDLRVGTGDSEAVALRLGRQELSYGSARLVGLREGPNIRRSFDAGRVIYSAPSVRLEGFIGTEVRLEPGIFDNSRNRDMLFWGAFGAFTLPFLTGNNELYYLGFDVEQASFDATTGAETRHTIGLRRSGMLGSSFRYNTEIMYQFGKFAGRNISAFAIETDYHYRLNRVTLRPEPGVKLDYISGDRDPDDGTLNTFNPLFTNPAYFGLLTQITPMNLLDVHPSLGLELAEGIELVLDWDVFWRAALEDGLYSPPRFLAREGDSTQPRFIGHQPGFELVYRVNRHVTWRGEASYFLSGPFIEESGESRNILHLASTMSFKF